MREAFEACGPDCRGLGDFGYENLDEIRGESAMVQIYHVDAFTDEPFRGNPAAVCLLDNAADENWMQQVAAEMNLSETAFVYRDGKSFQLRWFTPAVEVELCGHATLATSHILWETGKLAESEPVIYQSLSGELNAVKHNGQIQLDFPATPASETLPPPGLLEALDIQPMYVGLSKFDYLCELDSADAVRQLKPDYAALSGLGVRGVIVTSGDDSGQFDFVSRYFAPAAGINEDPVTGSAHCTLGPYWQARLGKSTLRAFQASSRGGKIIVSLDGDRTKLLGQAVTVVRGELVC